MLSTSLKYLRGVGPVRAALLEKELQIATFRDLLFCVPYKYIDRSEISTIASLVEDSPYVVLHGTVVDLFIEGVGRRRRMRATFTDGTGYCEIIWFTVTKALENAVKVNRNYELFGRPTFWNRRPQFSHPELELLNEPTPDATGTAFAARRSSLMAFYHTTEAMKRAGINSRKMGELAAAVFEKLGTARIPETLTDALVRQHRLLPLDTALRHLHLPPSAQAVSEATRRLKFDELFFLNLQILTSREKRRQESDGFVFARIGEAFNRFYTDHLPFSLTAAQKRVLREIRNDCRTGRQMNRLLQGDVGSGKTMVALMSCLMAIDNGFQACIMAPTEILAEQHFASLSQMLAPLGIRVSLLTGMVKGRQRRDVLQGIADGSIHILVGTHALIQPTVQFRNLGLAVIDEQHRFGVRQRATLWEKNTLPPHVLVMTATPIPRTLAMTVYGDLDVSIIDELPPGRQPVTTLHYRQRDRAALYTGLRRQILQGRQAYVVFPVIEGNETQTLADLETGCNQLCEIFPDLRIARVHGRLTSAEKDAVMTDFAEGRTHILVSTTVIEVGVNVPNATVMVVENAERFGLAQLHQLRGRVGRGSSKSYCILLTKDDLPDASQRRMDILCETTDGFRIAEEDLRQRGPGALDGTQQSGLPLRLRIASLMHDAEILSETRTAAEQILATDPTLTQPDHRILAHTLANMRRPDDFSGIS